MMDSSGIYRATACASANGAPCQLLIERVLDGGYVVTDTPVHGYAWSVRFACTTIEEALKFVKKKLAV